MFLVVDTTDHVPPLICCKARHSTPRGQRRCRVAQYSRQHTRVTTADEPSLGALGDPQALARLYGESPAGPEADRGETRGRIDSEGLDWENPCYEEPKLQP